MRWVKINKEPEYQPANGGYGDWKEELAEEAQNQCVYCAIHENSFGGIRTFHVEHFRPRSIFADLINVYSNLFYSCPICNTFKSNDWPNEPTEDYSNPAYIDPSTTDYNTVFDFEHETGLIEGNTVSAKYIQEKLYLNRPQLINERKINDFMQRANELVTSLNDALALLPDNDDEFPRLSRRAVEVLTTMNELQNQLRTIPRYRIADVRRPE